MDLIDAMALVSADDFRDHVYAQISEIGATSPGPVGIYVERELKKSGRLESLSLFPQKTGNRAIGEGPPAISPGVRDIGSEGIVAQLVTEFCRANPRIYYNHPGPDIIRSKKIRYFLLVTDFVGSGERSLKYLNAVWAMPSVKSWHSLHLFKFGVVCYSATAKGAGRIRHHPSRPDVRIVRVCPTIDSEFKGKRREAIISLCSRYDPPTKSNVSCLGYQATGALIAFSHGIPNNAPRLLHQASRYPRWVPLFEGRVTALSRVEFHQEFSSESVVRRLQALNQYRLSVSPLLAGSDSDVHRVVLVLASLCRKPRTEEAVAGRTGLTIPEVRKLIEYAKSHNLISLDLHVTDVGHRELRRFKKARTDLPKEVPHNSKPYYPIALRPPIKPPS